MYQIPDLDPVAIRYAAALRGVVPPPPEAPCRMVRLGPVDIAQALCLAASNPDSSFTYIMPDAMRALAAQQRAQQLRQGNCRFVTQDELPAGQADIFCADLGKQTDAATLANAQALAQQIVAPGGMFVCRYAPFPAQCDALQFMVTEFAAETPAEQHIELLHELKLLGHLYLTAHPLAADALDQALGAKNPAAFFARYNSAGAAMSHAVGMIATMAPAGFDFVGDAQIQSNYLEMMVPKVAQDVLYNLRGHLLYEVIKDYATARPVRTDIWVRQPAAMSGELPVLFGPFYYGLSGSSWPLPATVTLLEQTLDLTPPLFQRILELMRLMPLTIGDVLAHPDCQDFAAQDTVMAMQMLVAFGIAAPMRGSFAGLGQADMHYPRLVGGYNQQLQQEVLQSETVLFASPVAGRPLQLTLQEALVLQAVGRVGLAESADALMTELQRVASDPAIAPAVFPTAAPPAEDMAEAMIKNVCDKQMLSWYAYGVLDAA